MNKERSRQFMQKVVGDVGTAMAAALVFVGDHAGLFEAMTGAGPLSATDLVRRTGLHSRYVEEWLSAMVCAGYIEHDSARNQFELPEEHAMFLSNRSSEYYLGGMFASVLAAVTIAPRLVAAIERGEGIAFPEFGENLPLAFEGMNRAVYENRLVQSWLPAMPEVVRRLHVGGRAIDIGCGTGVVPVILAKAFPKAHIEGLDLDAKSIEIARHHAREAAVAQRVHFIHAPANALAGLGTYDLITTFDVVHDLPDPRGVLVLIRSALNEGGSYLMVEPKMDDRLERNRENPFSLMLYSISCLHCVPQSLAQGGPGLGACWGPSQARRLAAEAGFSHFDVLPIHSPALAFYELRA